MLRNRSRAVTKKQAIMADQTSLISPTKKNLCSPISSFLNSPRFFNGILGKSLFDSESSSIMSPTSILDIKNSSSFVNPFGCDKSLPKSDNNSTNKQESEAIGLALIDSITDEKGHENNGIFSKPINRMALFGSKLKVQIPVISSVNSPVELESPKSPADFGTKTKNSQVCGTGTGTGTPSKEFSRQLSLKEMELSEDYTCVITHGPNPKTTHIFDDCIVERCCGNHSTSFEHKEMDSTSPYANFLKFCHNCKDVLGQDKDIYMYRGEKAFCSHECRCQEIYFEGMKNEEMDDAF